MIAHPRSKSEIKALIEHTINCWESRMWHVEGTKETRKVRHMSRKELRPRARDLVNHCLKSPVIG